MLKILAVTFSFNPLELWPKYYITRKARLASVSRHGFPIVLDINNKGKHDGKWQLGEVPVTYAGFFSSKQVDEIRPRAGIGIFPVFTEEKSDTLSMEKHTMRVVKKAINFVNTGQTPVLEGDCPLYARQKRRQFLFPEEVGERQIVCMIGFLHLEMCAQEVGWCCIFSKLSWLVIRWRLSALLT